MSDIEPSYLDLREVDLRKAIVQIVQKHRKCTPDLIDDLVRLCEIERTLRQIYIDDYFKKE